jgi:hypothetical protein
MTGSDTFLFFSFFSLPSSHPFETFLFRQLFRGRVRADPEAQGFPLHHHVLPAVRDVCHRLLDIVPRAARQVEG